MSCIIMISQNIIIYWSLGEHIYLNSMFDFKSADNLTSLINFCTFFIIHSFLAKTAYVNVSRYSNGSWICIALLGIEQEATVWIKNE